MTGEERRIARTRGRLLQIVEDGRELDDERWTVGRLLLTNRRLVVVGSDDERTVRLSDVDGVGERRDEGECGHNSPRYTCIRSGSDAYLLATEDDEPFEVHLRAAVLDGSSVYVSRPPVEGEVGESTEWREGEVRTGEGGTVEVATPEGPPCRIDPEEVTEVETADRTVRGRSRRVVTVRLANSDGPSTTRLAGSGRTGPILAALFQRAIGDGDPEVDLDATERRVLTALYSGVSSFEVPAFTGIGVDEVEGAYERLVARGVLDEVRIRREVALTPRGRNVASEAINEE